MEKIKKFVDIRNEGLGEVYGLNDMMTIEIAGDGELWLHIADVQGKSLSEKINLLRGGLESLGRQMKHWDKLSDIKIISGTSWIVTKNPGLLRKLGFVVDNTAPGFERSKKEYYSKHRYINKDKAYIEPSYAYITRDRFLELYGD